METNMRFLILFASGVLLVPLVVSAQTSDVDYCNALTLKYQTYVASENSGHTPRPAPVDVQNAMEQCRKGNTAAGIPVLEQKLRDARVDLPKRS
jgi:hypothetical protein